MLKGGGAWVREKTQNHNFWLKDDKFWFKDYNYWIKDDNFWLKKPYFTQRWQFCTQKWPFLTHLKMTICDWLNFWLKKGGWCYSHRPLCPNYMPMFWLFHFNIFIYIKVCNKIHICTIFFRYCYFYAPALLKFGPTSFFQHIILNLYKFYNILILILCKSYAFDFNQDFFLEILDRAF